MSVLIAEDNALKNRPPRTAVERGARQGVRLVLLASLLLNSACAARAAFSQSAPEAPPTARTDSGPRSPAREEASGEEVRIADALVKGDALNHEGYTVRRQYKRVRLDETPRPYGRAEAVEVSYAVLERKGRLLARFDAGVYHGGLNATGFGLFPFLGGDTKQLFISQDAPREGRQWIVSLSPGFRVIYDGAAFGVGRETDDMGVIDLDGDGIYEVTVPVCDFYGFHDWAVAPMATPLPKVIFKYDTKVGKYLPANERFQDYLLKGVAEARAKVSGPEDREKHLADVLSVVLSYVFAGREQEGWAFYDAAYKLPDKAEVRKEVEATLQSQPVYRFMYGKTVGR